MNTHTINQHLDPTVRHEFVLLMEADHSLSNGDSNTGQPRVDPETSHGLWSPYSIKRLVRDYVQTFHESEGNEIFIAQRVALNTSLERAHTATSDGASKGKLTPEQKDAPTRWMAENFFDVRMFGAVMSTGDYKSNNLTGPLVLQWGRTVDPIYPQRMGITRCAITKEGEDKETEMGDVTIVPYGIYVIRGNYNPIHGGRTGVKPEDLALLWTALEWGAESNRSASRCGNACRGLYVFSHDTARGNAKAHEVHGLVQVKRQDGVAVPRAFSDYTVTVREDRIPAGVTLNRLYEGFGIAQRAVK